MFYAVDILTKKKNGRFAVIWLAATMSNSKMLSLSRRDYCNVDIEESCEEIKMKLTEGKRLSLYLSSQLMYGVVRIFKMQNRYLMDDLQALKCRWCLLPLDQITLKLDALPMGVDMANTDLTSPDPAFGAFIDLELVSPTEIQPQAFIEGFSLPEETEEQYPGTPVLRHDRPPGTPPISLRPQSGLPHQVSMDKISLRESPMVDKSDIEIPGEKELPPLSTEAIKDFSLSSVEFLPDETIPEHPAVTEVSNIQFGDIDLHRQQPMEETPANFIDPESMISAPRKTNSPRSPNITLISPVEPTRRTQLSNVSLELEPIVFELTTTPRKRIKRRLYLVDKDCHISSSQMKENLKDSVQLTGDYGPIQLKPDSSATTLLRKPGNKGLFVQPLLKLYTDSLLTKEDENLKTTFDIRGFFSVPDEVEEVMEQEQQVVVEPEMEQSHGAGLLMESMEHARGTTRGESILAEMETTPSVSVTYPRKEGAEDSALLMESIAEQIPSRIIESRTEIAESMTIVENLPGEISFEPAEGGFDVSKDSSKCSSDHDTSAAFINTFRTLTSDMEINKCVTFEDVCPPAVTKKEKAAKVFYALLALLKKKLLYVEQAEPFGEINIYNYKP